MQQKQLKVMFPEHLYVALSTEAEEAAVTMADLVRLAVRERYLQKATASNLQRLVHAYLHGHLSAQEFADKLVFEII